MNSQSTPSTCPRCGRVLARVHVYGRFWALASCPCGEKDSHNDDDAERGRMMRERYRRAGIPERYVRLGLDCTREFRALDGGGLYIHGGYGSGKTAYAAGLAMAAVRVHKSVLFTTVSQVVDGVFDRDTSSEDLYGRMARADLLVVDDIEKFGMNPHALAVLWRVVNDRYNGVKQTIITSNKTRAELAATLAATDRDIAHSIASRLVEMCETHAMEGGDRRVFARCETTPGLEP